MTLNAGTVPDPEQPHLCLFNTKAFYGLRGHHLMRHDLLGAADMKRIASIAGRDVDGQWCSGHQAPFAGFDWGQDSWAPEIVEEAVMAFAMTAPREVRVAMKPPHWSPNEAAVTVALLAAGFRVERADLNQWIDLMVFAPGEGVMIDQYVASLKHAARRAHEVSRERWAPIGSYDEWCWRQGWAVLERNRAGKGRVLSFDYDYLTRLRAAFPECVRMIRAVDVLGGQCGAAAIVYRVGKGRDMVQAWGSEPGLTNPSPMNALAAGVVAHSIATGARTLDLGISSSNGVIDAGLARFKRSVGAQSEVRMVVTRG